MDISKYNLIFAYKNSLGNWKEVKSSDMQHTPTHIILSSKDFNFLTDDFRDLENTVSRLNNELSKMESKHQEELRQANYYYSLELEKTQREVEAHEQALSQSVALNSNLKRICKERANADRGLKPKKEHSGFVCLSTSSYFERFKDNKDTVEFTAYKSVIQTPYDVSMDFDVVRSLVNEGEVFSCAMAYFGSNLNEKAYNEYQERNLVFRWQLRATTSKKFWEIEAYHTCPFNGENLFII